MSECKPCMSLRTQKWQKKNPEKYEKAIKHRNANPPESVINFWRNNSKKQKESGYFQNWQQQNPEKCKGYNKQHRNHDITDEQWIACKNYFDNTCAYCGLPIEKHYVPYAGKIILSDFHKEHVNDDGANNLSNCAPSCKSCNSHKWGYDFDDWYNENNYRFTDERYNKIQKWLNGDYKLFINDNRTA